MTTEQAVARNAAARARRAARRAADPQVQARAREHQAREQREADKVGRRDAHHDHAHIEDPS